MQDDPSQPPGSPTEIRERIIAALKTIYDPEIPVDIYELGLIYGVDVHEDGATDVTMTLTSPHCPAAQSLPAEVKRKTAAVPGVSEVRFELTWEPPWDEECMSEAARLELEMM